jgi:hypothetical protein
MQRRPNLAAVRVEPSHMARTHGYCSPVFRVWEGEDEYELLKLIKGGWLCRPQEPCVTVYRRGVRRIVLKTVAHDDCTGELAAVSAVAPLGLNDCIVPARVVHHSVAYSGPTAAENFTAVAMHDGGLALSFFEVQQPKEALDVLAVFCRKCRELFERGFAYTDMKPDNALHCPSERSFVLCDYGSVCPLGGTDAVCTFPPPEYPKGKHVPANERVIIYGLGVLMAGLIFPDSLAGLIFKKVKRKDLVGLADARLALEAEGDKVIDRVDKWNEAVGKVLRSAWLARPTLVEFEQLIQHAKSW